VNLTCCVARVQDKDTPLTMASGAGKVSTVRLLLSLGADVTLRNALGRTAQDLAKDPATAEIFTGSWTLPLSSVPSVREHTNLFLLLLSCTVGRDTTSRGQVPVAHALLKRTTARM
jgi:hypothetical protein